MIVIQRVVGHDLLAPGEWRPWVHGGKVITAVVSCPGCGFTTSLKGSHEIASDGTVSPSLDCPLCAFHDFVRLEGWQP